MDNPQRKIIITGHSSGLGRALMAHYLAAGWSVLGISRGQADFSCFFCAPALQQVTLDLSQTETLTDWLSGSLLGEFIHTADEIILINNAASVQPNAVAGRQDAAQIAASVCLNITAPLLLSNAVCAAKPTQARLKIAHIGSGAGRKAYPGWNVYGATKAALDQHARCMAAEQHPNVAVASIAPGVVDTGMQAQIRSANCDVFPLLSRFRDLYQSGSLLTPAVAAAKIAALIAADDFGLQPLLDIRE